MFAVLYLGNDLLVLGLGAYDWITRRRLHPAYVAGVAWTLALQLTAASLLLSPGWLPADRTQVDRALRDSNVRTTLIVFDSTDSTRRR